jgi:hypothetical protein
MVILLAITGVALLVTLILVITFFVFNKRREREVNDIYHNSRHYIFDFKAGLCHYFTNADTLLKKTITIDEFISKFTNDDQTLVRDWFTSLFESFSRASKFIFVDMRFRVGRKINYSVNALSFYSINHETQVLEIESTLFRYLPIKKQFSKTSNTKTLQEERIRDVFKSHRHRGATIYLSFYNKATSKTAFTEVEDMLRLLSLKNMLYRLFYQDANTLELDISETDFVIVTLSRISKEDAYQMVRTLLYEIKSHSEILGATNMEIAIGVVFASSRETDYLAAISSAKSICLRAITRKEEFLIEGFVPKPSERKALINVEKNEMVEEGRHLNYLYQPILSVNEGTIIGHLSFMAPTNQALFKGVHDIRDLLDIKQKSNPRLLESLVNNTVLYYRQNATSVSQLLFLDVLNNSIATIHKTLLTISKKDGVDVVVKFSEEDMERLSIEEFRGRVLLLKDFDYKLAIEIKNFDRKYNILIYELFDYIIMDFENFTKDDLSVSKDRVSSLNLINDFKKYNIPIIAYNIRTWSIIDFLILNGVRYIASDVLLRRAPFLGEISRNNLRRIVMISSHMKSRQEGGDR